MSILVKGVDMPKDCVFCKWHTRWGCGITGIRTNTAQGCPLVEVPTPHGRLIDADALEEKLNVWTRENFSFSDRYEYNLEGMIRASDIAMTLPTIIEAEGGE